ncbi:hypothetical protein FRB90_010920 [Tulasnella sp. 427]|nr:hypothetical protein FRB90_010920 [Tulasnella sp. 427]
MKGKTKVSDDGKEEEKNEEDFVIEFPTLNPTPGKPAPSSEPESTGDVQPAEQPPPPSGWMSPGFSPYPPEMVGYPAPWSPQATAYFHPRPYPPHHIPGASTPSASSASSSPAWTHLGLPPPNGGVLPRPNAVVASIPEGGDQEGQQQPSYAGSPPEEDLRRQSLANSIANKPGTAPSSVSGSVTSSPRVGFHHLHPVVAPSAMPPYPQPLSPLTPTSSHGNLLPNPHFMRQGTTPSPGPMANWQGNPGYFVPLPHPQWIGAQNSSRSGTPSGEHPGGSFLASPRSRSSSPFVGGRATPPVQPMYPGYFGQPPPLPHPNYPFGPAPVPPMQHSLMMQGLPPNPGSSYMNGRYPTPLQSRSRQNTASEAGGLEEERRDGDNDGLAGLPDADANDSEGFRAASVSSGRSSRGSSRAASAQLETGGGGTAKGGGPSPIEEEPPSTQTA